MEFSPANHIVQLSLQGMAMEDRDSSEEALTWFLRAWEEASCDFEKFLAAYYIARHQHHTFDTIYMTELITEKDIAELPANSEIKNIALDYTTIADIHTKNNEKQYLTIWTPGKKLVISETPDAGITTNDTGDSLVNDLRKGTLNFIQRNSALIFNPEVKDSVPGVFEKFRKEREAVIDRFPEVLNPEVIVLLHFQNDARIYSFLFWLGRISKKLDADDPYFDFITDIPEPSQFLKTTSQCVPLQV